MKRYVLIKSSSKHKNIKKKTYSFEAILSGMALTVSTTALGVVTIFSPNFSINDELNKEAKQEIVKIDELSENEISYYVGKAKDYYLNTYEGQLEMESGRAFIDYDNQYDDLEFQEETFEEKTIKKYCNIYHVDYDIVYKKLASLTDNFTSEEYLNGTIPGITLKKESVNFTNYETLLLVAVRCCKQTPEAIGLPLISVENYYVTDETVLEQIIYYSDLFQVDKKMVYAILKSECGFESDFTEKTNNLASIKFEGKFATFDNATQSIIELCTELYKYNKQGLYTASEIAPSYAPLEDDNENWLPNVKECYKEAEIVFSENAVFASNKL